MDLDFWNCRSLAAVVKADLKLSVFWLHLSQQVFPGWYILFYSLLIRGFLWLFSCNGDPQEIN